MPESMDLLTPNEALKVLKVDRRTLYGWLRMGKIPGAFKLHDGPKAPWRIPADALDRLAQRRKR